MKPLWEELENMADKLAVAGMVELKDIKTMRAAAVQMENWFEANQEAFADIDRHKADIVNYRAALKNINSALSDVSRYAGVEGHEMGDSTFARDFAPWANLMAGAHCDPDYGKPEKPKLHRDTRK